MRPERKAIVLAMMAITLVLLQSTLPSGIAQADIGPKPSMTFDFTGEDGTPPTITGGALLECLDAACTAAEPLYDFGPQKFSCEAYHCESMAYGYREHLRLEISFADGITRRSNIFGKEHFNAFYRVTVRTDDLLVEDVGGRLMPTPSDDVAGKNAADPYKPTWSDDLVGEEYAGRFNYIWYGLAGALVGSCLLGVLSLGVLVCMILLIRHAGRGPLTFGAQRGWILATWIICLLLVAGFTFFSPAILVTVLLELLLAAVIAGWRKLPRLPLFTAVLVANTITQLLLFAGLQAFDGGWTLLLFSELAIWLAEALILYLLQRMSISKRQALLLSLGLNTVSFAIGLVMPF